MITKEQDFFNIYYSPERYKLLLRSLEIKEEKISKYIKEYKSLYKRILEEIS